MSGFRVYQMTVAACLLRLPDLVAGGPKTADELAAETGTLPGSLRRMLRGLAVWGFFVEMPDGKFGPTPLSGTFRSDVPGLRSMTIMLSEEGYQAWGDLMYSLRTGKSAYEHMFGKSHFDRLGEDPELAAHFNSAMVEFSTRVAAAFAAACDFTGVRTVVDVGGGNGAVLMAVLQAHPEIQGVLFDLAQGLAGAREKLAAAGVAERVTVQEGSFFEAVPSGADLYLLKSVVHDWDDERALAILQTCARAMHPTSRLVLLERKLPARIESPDDAFTTVMGDVHMMVVLGGKERTADEYRDLLARAGLRMTGEIPIESDITAFEAVGAG
jgi:ubiquinone/menaquinone biosynthesis C-methylase UbiE